MTMPMNLPMNFMNNNIDRSKVIPPGVYYIRKDKEGEHYLEEYIPKFKEPPKLYGKLRKNVDRILRRYTNIETSKSLGVMLTGHSGTGKTTIAEVVSNHIIKMGFAVVMAVDINADIETIHYINNLDNVVMFFDEFGKNFNNELQDKMLTMMSASSSGRKLFFITENDLFRISRLITNRPGRVWYHYDFARIDYEVILEYCHDKRVPKEMVDTIVSKYDESTVFSFDHLHAIVTEHLEYPDETLDELISVLNLSILRKPDIYSVSDVTIVTDKLPNGYSVGGNSRRGGMMPFGMLQPEQPEKKEKAKTDEEILKELVIEFEPEDVNRKAFDRGRPYYIRMYNLNGPSLRIENKDIVKIDNDTGDIYLLVSKAFQVTLSPN